MDEWEQLDLAGRQITEILRYETEPSAIDDLLAQKDQINNLKAKMNYDGTYAHSPA